MSKKKQNCGVNFALLLSLPPTHDPPKKNPQCQNGEEISLGDLTVPPELTEIRTVESRKPQKIIPFQPSNKLEENLDKNMVENYKKIDDRMEFKK